MFQRLRGATPPLRRRAASAFFVLWIMTMSGCGGEPIEKVRELQDVHGDFDASLEILRELLEQRPDDPEIDFRYGLALFATGNRALAVYSLREALESPEWSEKAGTLLANALNVSGSYGDAIEVCGRLLEANPEYIPALLLRANAYLGTRSSYEEALADAERVLEIDPDNPQALVPRTVALLALERVEEAGEALVEIDALFRDDALGIHGSEGFCAARAVFAKESGELELAEQRFEACLEMFAGPGTVVQEAVQFFDGRDRRDRSEAILRGALAEVPEAHGYRTALALRLRAAGEREQAEALLREATDLENSLDAAEGWGSLASYLLEDSRPDEAVEAYREALKLLADPGSQLPFAYAEALIVAGRYDEAWEAAESIDVPAHASLVRGRVELERGDPAAALRHFEEGARLWPNNAVARYYAARAAERSGDFERAIEEYRYAMRVDSKATDAYFRLASLHAAAGREDYALAALGFMPGGRPEEEAAGLLHVELLARVGQANTIPANLRQGLGQAGLAGQALSAMAKGLEARAGPAVALEFLTQAGADLLKQPTHVDALQKLVEVAARAGQASLGLEWVEKALAEHPESAALHALKGQALGLTGAEAGAQRKAFERALELGPEEPRALLGLARIETQHAEAAAALDRYERASAARPDDPAIGLEIAVLLTSLGRGDEAERRLAALLDEQPWNARAALALAESILARGAEPERALELTRRAVEFGGGAEAEALLARLSPDPAEGA